MTFKQARLKINSLLKFGIQPGLERVSKFLELIDNPQDKLKIIHVAGTNGKGSTCTMIASVLKNAGYKTGLFLSPYVIDFRERFQINGEMISEIELSGLVENLFKKVENLANQGIMITEFEFVTALAFEWFCKNKCNIVVLEVGLGGRYDATNVIKKPEVSVITSISLDHTKILGDSVEKIAVEKCGIIKENGIIVVNPKGQTTKVLEVIKKTAVNLHNELVMPEEQLIKIKSSNNLKTIINYEGIDIKIPFSGDYQIENTKTAICALEILSRKFNISELDIKDGIETAFIPARLEILSENPIVLLDGAHNADAMKQLCDFIRLKLKGKRIICLFGVMRDKDVEEMLKNLTEVCEEFITVTVNNERAMDADRIAKIISGFNKCVESYGKDLELALKDMFSEKSDDCAFIVCGSLYLAAQIRPMIMGYLTNIL